MMRLVENLPHHLNLKCLLDNYFMSVPLLAELKKNGILVTGTIRSNWLLGCQLKGEKEIKRDTASRACYVQPQCGEAYPLQ